MVTAPLRDTVNEMLGWTVYPEAAGPGARLLGFGARVGQMLLLCSTALVCSLALKSLSLAFQVIGSTAGVAISFLLPAALGLGAIRQQGREASSWVASDVEASAPASSSRGHRGAWVSIRIALAWLLLVVGVLVTVTGVVGFVLAV